MRWVPKITRVKKAELRGAKFTYKPLPTRLAFGYHEYRTPMHGYAATHEAAMAAFAKSWRRE